MKFKTFIGGNANIINIDVGLYLESEEFEGRKVIDKSIICLSEGGNSSLSSKLSVTIWTDEVIGDLK